MNSHDISRKNTHRLLQAVEEGIIDKDVLINACLGYMSEDDVKFMMQANDILLDDDEDNEVDDDDLDDYFEVQPEPVFKGVSGSIDITDDFWIRGYPGR